MWVKATEATGGGEVYLNLSLARSIKGIKEGTIVQFDEADQWTVKEEPELLLATMNEKRPRPSRSQSGARIKRRSATGDSA